MPGRLELALPGRILVRGEAEQGCTLVAVQGRAAHLRMHAPGVEGRRSTAVAYLNIVGRIEGATVRVGHDRILQTIKAPEAKWARLRQQFARIAGMSDGEREDLRGHRRLVPDHPDVEVALPHGVVVAGRIRDLSRSGAAVETRAAVDVGDHVVCAVPDHEADIAVRAADATLGLLRAASGAYCRQGLRRRLAPGRPAQGSIVPVIRGTRSCKRPIHHDKRRYKDRWRAEAEFGQLRDFHRVATTQYKPVCSDASAVTLAAVIAF